MPQEAPRSLFLLLLLLLLLFLFLFLFVFIFPHMFPEGFPNRFGEHMADSLADLWPQRSATSAFPKRFSSACSPKAFRTDSGNTHGPIAWPSYGPTVGHIGTSTKAGGGGDSPQASSIMPSI